MRPPRLLAELWGLAVAVVTFAALALGTAAIADGLIDPVGMVLGASRREGDLRWWFPREMLPTVIAVAGGALALAGAGAPLVGRRSRRAALVLSGVAGFLSVVFTADLGLSLLFPHGDGRPSAAASLALVFPASWTFVLLAPDALPTEPLRRRRSRGQG